MRHSWADLSKNVCICRQCGMKRVENKTRYHAHSKPVMTYTRGMSMQSAAGDCENVWPPDINPEWRVSIYKEPKQAALPFDRDISYTLQCRECGEFKAEGKIFNDRDFLCSECFAAPRSYLTFTRDVVDLDRSHGAVDLDPSQWARDHDMDDDIPF